nr:hypothetical protein GCM10025699_33300 [Microbacterium flavescens]
MTRSTPRPIPARVRILAAILAVACVGLAIVGSVTFLVQRERVVHEVGERLEMQVKSLQTVADPVENAAEPETGEATATQAIDLQDFKTVEDFLYAAVSQLVPGRNEASVAILDGAPRFKPATLSGFDISRDQELIDRAVADTADGETTVGTAATDEGSLRYIAIPVQMEGDSRKGVYVRAVDIGAELEPVTAAMATYIIAALVVLAAIGVVGWFVTGRLLSPIRLMRETADAITIADLSPRLSTQGNDDISDLSRTVNSMLDRIEGSVDVQRQLLDDVRHELKTPITIVRGHLELMNPGDAGDAASAREIGIAELDRLARLVEDIDQLAAAEGDSYVMRDVDLSALTARVGELVAVIPQHAWTVEAHAQGSCAATTTASCRRGSSSPTTPPSTRLPARRSRSAARSTLPAPGCGSATTDPASRRLPAAASSAASTAPTASGASAARGSASRSSMRSRRATGARAPSPTHRAAAPPSPSTSRPPPPPCRHR